MWDLGAVRAGSPEGGCGTRCPGRSSYLAMWAEPWAQCWQLTVRDGPYDRTSSEHAPHMRVTGPLRCRFTDTKRCCNEEKVLPVRGRCVCLFPACVWTWRPLSPPRTACTECSGICINYRRSREAAVAHCGARGESQAPGELSASQQQTRL